MKFRNGKGMKKRDVLSLLLMFALSAASAAAPAQASGSKNTNITVDTAETGLISLNKKTSKDPDERATFYEDESTTVGFNEQGDPAVGMRF